ncbi:MAG TPA: Rossmann-like and DUF2520 domain-containing protein [Sphingobacteriaceae bacterium]
MKIALLGSGNVATHLGRALKTAGEEIIQVWSRSMVNASALAVELAAVATDDLSGIRRDADLYIISVNDDAIESVASQMPDVAGRLVVHTSGSTGMEVLGDASHSIGVLYPLQTFSKLKDVDFSRIPIAVEGSTPQIVELLSAVAGKLSHTVVEMTSAQRRTLHVAAVFACNFTNHFFAVAADILKREGFSFEIIRPLIAETADKIQISDPQDVQTGPAVRRDNRTMEKHLEILKDQPALAEIYEKVSQSIINLHKQDRR